MTAHPAISCDQARLALSARLDGEPLGMPADRLGWHVDTCPACADWLSRAERVTRLVRVQPVRVPDLTETIMAAVVADQASLAADRARTASAGHAATEAGGRRAVGSGRQALTRVLQTAIAAIAAMQLFAITSVVLGISADQHADHEAGAFAAAVAAAFLLAAFRPRLARAYTPIAVVLAVCLTVTSRMGMGEHPVTMLHEIGGYLGAIVQAGLIFALGRLYPSSDGSPDRPVTADPAGITA
jgi:predicted anti-sigma-YlaC factor YlaD